MSLTSSPATDSPSSADEAGAIARLARGASVELTWHDAAQLGACRRHLAPRSRVYVSFVPGQTWRHTIDACVEVRRAGLEPVPHIPARELASAGAFENLASQLRSRPAVRRVLLIAGDRAAPAGPFASSLDALRSGVLGRNGIVDVAVAGYPEGHPRIPEVTLRHAEREKFAYAAGEGIALSFVTQFFFEAEPFLAWVRRLRAEAITVPIDAGIAGPAGLATIAKFALRCGVGASIRALGTRTGTVTSLVAYRGPERLVRAVARAASQPGMGPLGLHLYSFGGAARTCEWLEGARGALRLDDDGGFSAAP